MPQVSSRPTPVSAAPCDVLAALAALPDDERQVLVLRLLGGWDIARIAARTAQSAAHVEADLARAQRRLVRVLRPDG